MGRIGARFRHQRRQAAEESSSPPWRAQAQATPEARFLLPLQAKGAAVHLTPTVPLTSTSYPDGT